jgi:hypothetical protein
MSSPYHPRVGGHGNRFDAKAGQGRLGAAGVVEAAFYAALDPPFADPSSHGLPVDQEDIVWVAIDYIGELKLQDHPR